MAFVIPTIFSAVDRVTPVAQRIEASIVGMATGANTATAALATSFRNIGDSMLSVATNAAIFGAAIMLPLVASGREAMKFEKSLGNINTIVDQTKESIGGIGDKILALSRTAPKAIDDLSESMYQIYSDGYEGAKALEILDESSKLAVTGLSSTTEAAESIASALNVFTKETLTAHEVANQFFNVVNVGRTTMAGINESFGDTAAIVEAGGVKFREFNAMVAALTISGMTASESMTAIRGAVMALIKPSIEMEKTLRSLGIATGQELIERMGGLVPAMDAVGEAAKRNGLNINESFGRVQGLTAFTLLTGNLRHKYEDDLKLMHNGADYLSQGYSDQLQTAAAKSQLAMNAIHELGIRTGELLLPVLGEMAVALGTVAGGMADFAHNHQLLAGLVTGSLATFGSFTLAIAAGAAAIYVITKAIWLWNLAIKAVAFAQGFLTVATGGNTAAILANSAASRGAAVAAKLFSTATWGAVFASRAFWLALGPVGLALAVVSSAMSDDYDTIGRYNESLGETKDKFEQVKDPITQAALALQDYNQAMKDYNDYVDFIAHREYRYSKGQYEGLMFDIKSWFTDPSDMFNATQDYNASTGNYDISGSVPDAESFPGLDMEALRKQEADADIAKPSKVEVHNFLHLTKDGQLTINRSTAVGGTTVAPVITTTHNPSTRSID